MSEFKHLLEPFQIGGVTIKNRMVMGSATVGTIDANGTPSAQAEEYYVKRAKGGFGLIMHQAVFADNEIDPIYPGQMYPLMDPATFMARASDSVERMHAYGRKVFIQVTMGPGRNGGGFKTPSTLPVWYDPSQKSEALTREEIKRKIEMTVQCAALMKQCGFDGVEVHAMHWGYLLDEFALEFMNKRDDEYGGCLENRLRICKEVVEGIKAACGKDYPVTMKMGVKSFIRDFNVPTNLAGEGEVGRTVEEAVEIAKLLESYGYDGLTCNSGMYDSMFRMIAPSYAPKGQVLDLVKEIKKAVNIPVMALTRMNDPWIAEEAIASGKCDAAMMVRGMIADPDFPAKVLKGIPEKIRPCLSCNMGCINRGMSSKGIHCVVNPAAGRELFYGLKRALEPKKVVIVGGGVCGMEAARSATLCGHEVVLLEKSNQLGGNLNPASAHEFKNELKQLNRWYQNEMKDMGIDVRMNVTATADMIREMNPDVVILAQGANPIMPAALPGIDHEKTVCCTDVLLEKAEVGQKVVVVGGGLTGSELAADLAMQGKEVHLVEMLDDILSTGPATPFANSQMLRMILDENQVDILTGHRLEKICDEGAVVSDKEGNKRTIEADTVIMSVGLRPEKSLEDELKGMEVYRIGDGRQVGNIQSAIWEAYEVARLLG